MSAELLVLDSSVGVKWFRREAGTEEADEILSGHRDGSVGIIVPSLFLYEVTAVGGRDHGPDGVRETWRVLAGLHLGVVAADADLIDATAAQSERLGCTFYDSLAPALADRLEVQLVSADKRAHGTFPGVHLVG